MNDNEHALLTIIAQDPDWTRQNASQLSPIIFGNEAHRLVYEAITECGHYWDMASITAALRYRNNLDAVGGPSAVSEYWTTFPVMSMAAHHLEATRNAAALRRALKAHKDAQASLEAALTQGTEDSAKLLADIREQLDCAARLPGKRLERLTSRQAMDMVIDQIEERSRNPGAIAGVTTGFGLLDKITHGLQHGHLWVVAGGPGDGKSAMMQNILEGAVKAGEQTAVYQLEMPIEEQAMRFLASDSGVDSGDLLTGLMTNEQQIAIAAAVKRLKKSGTDYINTDTATAEDILNDIENSSYRVVMVDYLQLLDIDMKKGENREQAMSTVARRLKNVAKRKGCTILTGSQLNDDGRLRESRAIGMHADKVLFVNKVMVDEEPDPTRRTLIIAKNRGGQPHQKIPLRFAGASYSFRESTADEVEEPNWTETMPNKPKTRSNRP